MWAQKREFPAMPTGVLAVGAAQCVNLRIYFSLTLDLELILMHHFSRILRLDVSSVLGTALNSLVTGLTLCISTITQNMVNQKW